MNIYEKLVEIRKTIDVFTKDTKGFNYSYVSGAQVLKKIKSKMDELKVILEPHVFHKESHYEIFQYVTTDKNGKEKNNIDYLINAPMEYHWINAENPDERVKIEWSLYGQQDEISKAFGSGLTYSERYFLLKYFGVPTDEDDPDTRQDKPQDRKPNNNGKLSEAQVNRAIAIGKSKGITLEQIKKTITKDYGKTEIADLTKEQYNEVCNRMEKAGVQSV